MNKNIITLAVQVAIWGSLSTITGKAYAAQDQDVEKQTINQTEIAEQKVQEEKVEKITVTGSRLRRDSFSVSTPLATMDREDIQSAGIGSLAEILLEEMPILAEEDSNTNTQSQVHGSGLSTIDLRNLGSERTLTLIDGRRTVSNSYSSNKVSLSTIPSGMVKNVEIITGGASAAYGSDAIAGVVNIITQQYKEGLEISAKGSESAEGGAEEFSIALDYGTEFADGKGYMYFSSNYEKEYGLTFADRERAQLQIDDDYDEDLMCNTIGTVDGEVCMRDTTQDQWADLNDGIFGGVFGEGGDLDNEYWYDGNVLRNDWEDNEERYGINSTQFRQLKTPEDATSVALKVDYELSDDLEAYFQVQYSNNSSINYKSPENGSESTNERTTYDAATDTYDFITLDAIPFDNPYVPQEIRDANPDNEDIKWDRRFNEVGQIIADNSRDTVRVWGGLQGTAFDGDWDWDLSVGYGKFTQRQTRYNELYVQNWLNAVVDVEQLDDGTIQCASEEARANGCVPLNMFGEGSITEEAADYIRANPTVNSDIEQVNFLGYMAGDLFELPAGTVGSVFGFEYRKDTQSVSTNVPEGGITFNYVPTFSGSVEVAEVFAEMSLPLVKGVTAVESLDLELSGRLADYSSENVDLIKSYSVGLIWQIVDGYGIRANYSRAQRAPSITELGSPARGDYDSYDDICDGVTATSDDAGHDNCRLDPMLAALLAEDEDFEHDDDNSGYSPAEGNSQLFEETGETYTVGITMAPDFLDGLQLAIDYYDIKISDVISEYENEDIIEACYDGTEAYGSDNTFCNDIIRDGEGQITQVTQRVYNLNERRTRGYDIAAEYRYDMDEYGRLKFKLSTNHVIEWTETADINGTLTTNNHIGDIDLASIFRDKASASLQWKMDDWSVKWSTSYKSSTVDDKGRGEDWLEAMADNDERCAAGLDALDCIANPETLAFYEIGSYIKHSLSMKYSMELAGDTEIDFRLGIKNIFDNNGAISAGSSHYYSTYGGGVGRRYTAGISIKF